MIASPVPRGRRPVRNANSGHDGILQDDDRYRVVCVPADEIKPSPENDDLYGQIEDDAQMAALVESIQKRGLEEPLVLTADRYILSGHRRFHAIKTYSPGWFRAKGNCIPCRIRQDVRREGNPQYYQELAEYNPQRIKTAGSLLKEALLRSAVGHSGRRPSRRGDSRTDRGIESGQRFQPCQGQVEPLQEFRRADGRHKDLGGGKPAAPLRARTLKGRN